MTDENKRRILEDAITAANKILRKAFHRAGCKDFAMGRTEFGDETFRVTFTKLPKEENNQTPNE